MSCGQIVSSQIVQQSNCPGLSGGVRHKPVKMASYIIHVFVIEYLRHTFDSIFFLSGGGPLPEINEGMELVLDALSPQTKYGIHGQSTETDPLSVDVLEVRMGF